MPLSTTIVAPVMFPRVCRGSVATLQSPRGRLGWMRLLASSVCGLFKWRQFEPEVILLAVGWYLRFSLSYLHIEWGGIEPLGFVRNLVGRHEEKFGVFVHELPDEPRAGHTIYFNSLSSNPFHGRSAPIIFLIVVNSRRTCSAHATLFSG